MMEVSNNKNETIKHIDKQVERQRGYHDDHKRQHKYAITVRFRFYRREVITLICRSFHNRSETKRQHVCISRRQ